jgi:hypothetical protein
VISGTGLAIAKMIGSSAIARTYSAGSAPRPKAEHVRPTSACSSVRAGVSTAWALCHWFRAFSRPW